MPQWRVPFTPAVQGVSASGRRIARCNAGKKGQEVALTGGISFRRIDLLTSRRFSWSKNVAFRKERCPKGNLAGMVFEYETSALHIPGIP